MKTASKIYFANDIESVKDYQQDKVNQGDTRLIMQIDYKGRDKFGWAWKDVSNWSNNMRTSDKARICRPFIDEVISKEAWLDNEDIKNSIEWVSIHANSVNAFGDDYGIGEEQVEQHKDNLAAEAFEGIGWYCFDITPNRTDTHLIINVDDFQYWVSRYWDNSEDIISPRIYKDGSYYGEDGIKALVKDNAKALYETLVDAYELGGNRDIYIDPENGDIWSIDAGQQYYSGGYIELFHMPTSCEIDFFDLENITPDAIMYDLSQAGVNFKEAKEEWDEDGESDELRNLWHKTFDDIIWQAQVAYYTEKPEPADYPKTFAGIDEIFNWEQTVKEDMEACLEAAREHDEEN